MAAERKTLTQLSMPICLETLFYMLSGMVDTLMLSSVSDQAVGAVGTANTYISVFIIMFGVISSGMIAVMSQNIGAGRPGIAYQARQLGLIFNALIGIVMSVVLAAFSGDSPLTSPTNINEGNFSPSLHLAIPLITSPLSSLNLLI